MEIEKDIASLQRYVRECYQAGLFSDAIDGAKESLKVIDGHFGKEHPVYASTLNDMAVMHKVHLLSRLTTNEVLMHSFCQTYR
jgi:hypothetical protein